MAWFDNSTGSDLLKLALSFAAPPTVWFFQVLSLAYFLRCQVLFVPLVPIMALYSAIPFANLAVFLALFFLVVSQ